MPRRSRPLLIAPVIPLLGILGMLGLRGLDHTRYFKPFIVIWCLALAALFSFVLREALLAKKKRESKVVAP